MARAKITVNFAEVSFLGKKLKIPTWAGTTIPLSTDEFVFVSASFPSFNSATVLGTTFVTAIDFRASKLHPETEQALFSNVKQAGIQSAVKTSSPEEAEEAHEKLVAFVLQFRETLNSSASPR